MRFLNLKRFTRHFNCRGYIPSFAARWSWVVWMFIWAIFIATTLITVLLLKLKRYR